MLKILRPAMELLYRAVVHFFKYWRDAPWAAKLMGLPLLALCLLFLGLYTFLFGCRV